MKRHDALAVSLFLSVTCLADPLIPAGTGGNPSFEIGVSFSELSAPSQVNSLGQATLIRREKKGNTWHCVVLTAAHCLSDGPATSRATYIHTADFGVLDHPRILSRTPELSEPKNDTSLIFFQQGCEKADHVPVVPVGELPESHEDRMGIPRTLQFASRTFRTLFPAVVPSDFRRSLPVIKLTLDTREVNGTRQMLAVYAGDSGGGLFMKNPNSGAMTILGVVSQGEFVRSQDPHRVIHSTGGAIRGIFASDLDWVREKLAGN